MLSIRENKDYGLPDHENNIFGYQNYHCDSFMKQKANPNHLADRIQLMEKTKSQQSKTKIGLSGFFFKW